MFLIRNHEFFSENNDSHSDVSCLIGSLNEARFNDDMEERCNMKLCSNLYCPRRVPEDIYKRAKGLQFIMTKDGCKKIENLICFCDGTLQSSEKCKPDFEKIERQVKHENEGGPFGTPMRKLVDFLTRFQDHPKLIEFERSKIKKLLTDFDDELNKVSAPIVEKFESVTKRVVEPDAGNPSDKAYKEP